MKNIKTVLIAPLLLIGLMVSCAPSKVKQDQAANAKGIEFLLPVNAALPVKSRINLVVSIPEDFHSLVSIEKMMSANMVEFIPKTDKDINHWSEIITVFKFIGSGLKASYVRDHLINSFMRDAGTRVLESTQKDHGSYSEATVMMAYSDKGRKEIILAKYYSGPYDCSGFQYAIALDKNMTEQKAREKIMAFATKKVMIINF